jgi:hypothetical protein
MPVRWSPDILRYEAAAALDHSASAAINTGTASNVISFGWTAAAGNLLVCIVGGDDYVATPPTGYTQSTGCGQQTYLGHYLWWKVAAGGETGLTYVLGSAATSCWIAAEISGLDASPYDISNGQLDQSSGSTYTTPTITPTSGDRYLIASIGGTSDAGSMTLGTWLNSFTERQDISNTLGSGVRDVVGYADLSVTANGSTGYSSGATYSGQTSQARTGIIIAFKVGSGGWTPQVDAPEKCINIATPRWRG